MTTGLVTVEPDISTTRTLGRTALRYLGSGMLLLVLVSASVLGYGLWQSAAITAHQVGQLEANLLAEGEAERLRLTFPDGLAQADPQQVEAMLMMLARDRQEIQSLEIIGADKKTIARHVRQDAQRSRSQGPGWHSAIGRIEFGAAMQSELHVSTYRERETLLSADSLLVIFSGFALVWAGLVWLLLRHFCRRFIEAPGERLQRFRRGAAAAEVLMLADGIWSEAAQAERAKLEKLHRLLHTIRRRSTDIEHHLPSLGEEVRTVIDAIEDLRHRYPEAWR